MDKLMKLNIQMFAEEADNATEDFVEEAVDTEIADGNEVNTEETVVTENDSEEVIDEKKLKTKAFSKRLNEEREKIRLEIEYEQNKKLDQIAKGRGFESWSELEEYSEKERIERLGVTDEEGFRSLLDELVAKNPTVQKAQQLLAQQEEERKVEFIKTQVKEINNLDSDIKTFDDLTKLDKYDEFAEKVEKGYTLADAYKLVYFDKLQNKATLSTKQQVLNNIDSKSHMKTASGNSATEIHIPSDIMAMYKKNLPKLSEAEIRKHYANYMRGE